jgi:hypothetical protein
MRQTFTVAFFLVLAAITLAAESKNPKDYPLRLHLIYRNQTTFFHNRVVDEVRGEGRGNLFENSMARGVDFSFNCPQKIELSFGMETYPARWKKPNQELVILFPVFGKADSYFTCNFKTKVRDDVYFYQNGRMTTLTPDQFKAWMVKHEYDPERGKNKPKFLGPPPPQGTPTPPAAPAATPAN